MKIFSKNLYLANLSLALLMASPVFATSVARMSTSQLAKKSDEIFVGKVHAHRFVNLHGQIFTAYDAEVLEQINSSRSVGEHVWVHLIGGQEGGMTYSLAGYERAVRDGSNYVFFLERMSDGLLSLTGWHVKQIVEGPAGQKFVRSRGDTVLLNSVMANRSRPASGALSFESRDEADESPVELNQFKSDILRGLSE